MKIRVDSLRSDGFRLELPGAEGRVDLVEIARAVHLRGVYEQDTKRIHVDQVTADELDLAMLEWHLAGGRVLAPGRVELREVLLDLQIARGELRGRPRLTGRIAIAHGHLLDAVLELGEQRYAADLELTGLAYEQGGRDIGAVTVDEANARSVAAKLGTVPASADTLDLAGVRVAWSHDALQLGAEKLELTGLKTRAGSVVLSVERLSATKLAVSRAVGSELTLELATLELHGVDLQAGGLTLRLEHVALPAGIRYSATGGISFPSLTTSAARVAVDGLARPLPAASVPASPPKRGGSKRSWDLSFLDRLDGRVDVDATVDARVPFLRRRVATHHFRVPIRHGTLNYRHLERDLSTLEDALLDFAVRSQRLVLEVNVLFKKQTLVEWPLQADEVGLAEKHVVKLTTLPLARVPAAGRGKTEGDKSSSSFELKRLDFDPIDVELRLGGPGELTLGSRGKLHLGAARKPAIGELKVSGAVHHRPGASTQPTELRVGATKIRVGAERLRLDRFSVDAAEITIGAVEQGVVVVAGLRPASVRATLRDIVLRDVSLTPGRGGAP